MKFKTNKLSLNLVLASSLLAASIPAFAVTGDTDQPIHIESDQQSLICKATWLPLPGNVIVTQGTIKINADKVVVTRPGGEQGKEVIDGYGKPATFYQMQDNGKPVEGHASQMHYELAKDFVVLTVMLICSRSIATLRAISITYLVKEQKMQAFSDKGKRVTTVLAPLQPHGQKQQRPDPGTEEG